MDPLRPLRRLLPALLLILAGAVAAEPVPEATAAFVDRMVEEHGFDRDALEALLADAERQEKILETIARPAERRLSWGEYRRIFLGEDRIAQGVAFWDEHAELLARAEARYGVDAQIVVGILGVETRYGRLRGSWRVLDALATLAFAYPPRSGFFTGELEAFLLLMREEGLDPREPLGSYAGAMGWGQFIPSSWRAYGVDFDGDGRRDLARSLEDAVGSVAHYLARHGWRRGEPVALAVDAPADPASVPTAEGLELRFTVGELRRLGVPGLGGLPEDAAATFLALEGEDGTAYHVGLHNLYVLTRYNRSHLYALAVRDLGRAVAAARARPVAVSPPADAEAR
ncbi:MAG: lytic murein transglycosylase B [Pseudomonadales bacterium]|jgi:membrane-bound lytic murein transglycosylase B|nr:lytic murein transglycosylase B [Pseudomonadales bacterium]